MEVRNNTPSFGMAFIKPKAEDLSGFTKCVIGNRRPKLIARGLTQMQKSHAADRYTDIHYLPDAKGFSVIPKSDSGVDLSIIEKVMGGTSRPFYSNTVKPTRYSQMQENVSFELDKLEKSNASKLKKALVITKNMCKMLKETARVAIFSPKEMLPASLRAASAEAKRVEAGVSEELAKRAAREQRRIANEKLIDEALK